MEPGAPELRNFFTSATTEFEAAHPGDKVEVQFVPWASAHDQFVTAIGGGQVPDVAEMGSTWTPEFGDIGALEPAELAKTGSDDGDDGADRFVSSLVEGATVDGTVYGVPWYAGARALIYRTDVLASLGLSVPTTWKELVSVGQAIRDRTGMAAFGVAGNAAHYVLPMVWQNGGEIAYEKGGVWRSGMDEPKAVQAVQFYADLSLRHGVVVKRGAPSKPFREGGAAMWLNTGWAVSPDLREVSLFKWGMAPIPWKTTNKTLSFTDCVLITNATKAQDASWSLVKYLTGKEGQLAYSQATGRPPTRTDSFDPWLDLTLKLPGIQMTKENVRQVVTGYLGNHVDNWAHYSINAAEYQLLQREQETKILTGALAVGPAMTELKTRTDAVMKDTYDQFRSSQLVKDTPC
jgi:N,N'-diacetylchitobiose transport system substrate-binding protein